MAHIVDQFQKIPTGSEAVDRKNTWRTRVDNNLVISNRRGKRSNDDEPTGEAESLFGKITKEMMGDHAQRTDPKEILKNLKEYRKDIDEELKKPYIPKRNKKVYDLDEIGGYVPTTKATKEEHAKLLSVVQHIFSDKSFQFIRSATLDILDILKSDITANEKYQKLKEEISQGIKEDEFTEMLQIADNITDYIKTDNPEEVEDENNNEGEDEVIPILNDSEEEGLGYSDDEIQEEQEQDEETNLHINNPMVMEDETKNNQFDNIDAFWLQRIIKGVVEDDNTAQEYAMKIEQVLGNTSLDDGSVEHIIMSLLGQQNFGIVDMLAKNREEIIGRIAIARAPNEEIKEAIREKLPSQIKFSMSQKQGIQKIEEEKKIQRTMRTLDLNALIFEGGNHFISNQQAIFPENTVRIDLPDYTQVDIPFINQQLPPTNLISISSLPEWAQRSLTPLKYLNRMQSTVYPTVFETDDNVLVCAPTGAGKTTVALLTILHEVKKAKETHEQFKIIYIAPMKSLVQEIVGTLQGKLENLGMKVAEMSGDSSLTKKELEETDVIVATPEKIDVITRKIGGLGSGCGHGIFEYLKVMIIDEVHLLHDTRGPVLEALVARIKLFMESNSKYIRLVGLSATLPNCGDVGIFLNCKKENVFVFGSEYRPVPLQQTFFGVADKKPLKQVQIMNRLTFQKVKESAGKQQVLIFVHSRKDTLETAKYIKEMALQENCLHSFLQNRRASQEVLLSEAKKFDNEELKELIGVGIGIHHAGMNKEDRRLIEDLYADNHLQVLVSTATLAWGVNLPAHTVIIKGTQIYSPPTGRWEELSPMDVMQMIGRAGRPQFDKEGTGIIITTQREMFFYMSLLSQQLPIESQFIGSLVDNLNAEVVIGNIKNIDDGIKWLTMTYYYICILRSPLLYGLQPNDFTNDPTLESRRRDLIHTAASLLHANGLAIYDKRKGTINATELGRISSYYYLTTETIKSMNESLKKGSSEIDLMNIFSKSSEFKYVSIRETEKIELETLLNQVPIPIKSTIEDPSCKISVLLQVYIGRLTLPGFVLASDTIFISQNAARIFRALFELLLIKRWARPALKALELCKSVTRRLFNSQCPLRQIPGVPNDICKRLERVDFPFERLFDLTSVQLGELIRLPTKGNALYNIVHSFPLLNISTISQPINRTLLQIKVSLETMFNYDYRIHGTSLGYWIIVLDGNGDYILYYQYFILKQTKSNQIHHLNAFVPLIDPLPFNYFVYCISDSYLKCSTSSVVSLRHLVLPTKVSSPSELLGMALLPTQTFYQSLNINYKIFSFDLFNALQTQLYQAVVETNNSLYIASHSGSGKTVIAEMGLLKHIQEHNGKGAIYVMPFDEERDLLYLEMKNQSISVEMMKTDNKEVEEQLKNVQVILASVHNLERYLRDWKQNGNIIRSIGIIILDDLQRVGEDVEYEMLISRIKTIQKEYQNNIRIIGLSLPISDSKSMREWLGVTQNNCYSFSMKSRVYPINVQIEIMKQTEYSMRLQAMIQPTIELLFNYWKQNKKSVITVPSKKLLLNTVQQFILLLQKNKIIQFNNQGRVEPKSEIEEIIKQYKIKNEIAIQGICSGIGIIFNGEDEEEKIVIKNLFREGIIKTIFLTFNEIEYFREQADEGILMGTIKSESNEKVLELEMIHKFIGCIKNGSVMIYCEPNKKEYLSKFLEESLPLESRLIQMGNEMYDNLIQLFNTEIANQTIVDYQSAINLLTSTFFYRRIRSNPSYYFVEGREMSIISNYLSGLVETVFDKLKEMKFITIDEQTQTVQPTETGILAVNQINDTMELD
ncbi:U5 small nuclear ribonucleoprotein 200 kDa helicase, putative [Entamoeba dispar SAW760]|uniref:U5 small nuclear ribonucleoprotein 200 kDa helicase n=1 Tax=Entamoeba dispar (strain ATCC PRA-260 / SAW760) TaxID=370354 RepID=B0EE60_ENTDS|nr:U5 small nuclear ribonucleoprotein 200 kDa helicase, putative [Entamoeba dispar SAW760]EDR27184.1 U5 small nuclear ribonucleoprotein 200 kDa helicase, putative [Entamoeba dispar SAW760]|eukprot:EDR27184.1 U5 small nuclear ribonucleoprotein 200 kDa helicase, putative [Entamoeba dispar SAW760]